MDWFGHLKTLSVEFLPTLLVVVLSLVVLMFANYSMRRRWKDHADMQFRFQMIMLGLTFLAGLTIIVSLPISDTLRGQLLSLIGILLSAAIALSSTTFIGNILAGIMLKIIKSIRPGDFVTVEETTGRVTEMNLLHTEVQTEDRDLVTLPNMLVVTKPMKVVRSSGTIVSAEVSLGYEVPRRKISEVLRVSAEAAGLKDAFVQIRGLGDFSVTYRVAGLLEEVSSLLSSRSKLREEILDGLHDAGIEIVSPGFMNTRVLKENTRFIPESVLIKEALEPEDNPSPDEVVFDKADSAASVESLRKAVEFIEIQLEDLEDKGSASSGTTTRQADLELEKARLESELREALTQQKLNDLEFVTTSQNDKA